jgi:hypothetical protein
MPTNAAIGLTVLLAMLTGVFSIVGSEAPLIVTAYGLRCNYLHLPLIFVMQRVLSGEDVLWMGRRMMWIMLPMAVLVVQQFRSPPGSLINLGGMPTQYGTVRPAGTFSFVSGMVCFSALAAAFLAHTFTAGRKRDRLLGMLCAVAVLASLAVSGSRSSILAVGIVFVMLIGLGVVTSSATRASLALVGVLGLGAAGLSSTEFFEEGQRQLSQRFEDASHGQGVMESSMDRFLDMFNYPIWAASEAPLLGHGQGTGTNAGYFLITGKRGFGGGQETEFGRIMYEMGPIFGTIFILLRLGIAWEMLTAGFRSLKRGQLLCLLIFGAAGMNVIMGTWGIPNTQGFACFGGGLCLAAAKVGLENRRNGPIAKRHPWRAATPPAPEIVTLPTSDPATAASR